MTEGKMQCCGSGKSKWFTILGVAAIVYGIINYLTTVLNWSSYTAWVAGGVILLLVGWAKKSMMNKS